LVAAQAKKPDPRQWLQLNDQEQSFLREAGWTPDSYNAEVNGTAVRVSPLGIDDIFDLKNLDGQVLGHQMAPLAFSALSSLSAEAQVLAINPALASKHPATMVEAAAATLLNQMLGRSAAFASLAATQYQYTHGLHGTTAGDVDVAWALTIAGLFPHPAIQLPATHLSTLYTGLRTYGVIEPIDVYYERFTGKPWR
jgi:hypothetical protein